ncbi:lipoprotein [Cytobacillus depressus]|uniref:Lipoprotein n=1 Tax=Cytobacillus depressus TaxID=1602942 RepID=A0A6L3V284_9BACI|nr:lipoprotein [Cytobacillus depressus]KAB2332310.1 lipoprotein [Cytobacillus depressus]
MKLRIALLSLAAVLILAACGQKGLKESITLVNQDNEKVTFPSEKPVLFFFITGYT